MFSIRTTGEGKHGEVKSSSMLQNLARFELGDYHERMSTKSTSVGTILGICEGLWRKYVYNTSE